MNSRDIQRASKLINYWNQKSRTPYRKDIDNNEIMAMYDSGMNIYQITKELNSRRGANDKPVQYMTIRKRVRDEIERRKKDTNEDLTDLFNVY